MEVLKVASQSGPKTVAKALALILRKDGEAELHALRAGAVNQAVKAAAVARG